MGLQEWAADLAFSARCAVGESPCWDADRGGLYWTDIPAGTLWFARPGSAPVAVAHFPFALGFVVPLDDRTLLAGTASGFGTVDKNDGRFLLRAPIPDAPRGYRLNDGKCDRAGRAFGGTVSDSTMAGGHWYRLDPDFRLGSVELPAEFPNGIGWTYDGRTVVVADTMRHVVEIRAYDTETGRVGPLRAAITVDPADGLPDGLTVDGADTVWLALWGGHQVRRYALDGTLLGVVRVPAPYVASCAFGGDEYRTLYITTAARDMTAEDLVRWPLGGSVFQVRTDAAGFPPDRYRPA